MPQQIRHSFEAETKALEDTRSLVVKITTPTPDRSGDVVNPLGAQLDNFKKNPVVLFGHDYWSPPVAKCEELEVNENGIIAKVTFPEKGTYALADTIYELYKQGVMHAWSIGFRANREKIEWLDSGGRKFNEWEMYEFSAVPVPANPEAVTLLRSQGVEESVISKAIETEVIELQDDTKPEAKAEVLEVSVKTLDVDLTDEKDGIKLVLSINDQEQSITHLFTDEQRQALNAQPEAKSQLADQLKAMRESLQPTPSTLSATLSHMKTILEPISNREGVTK